MEEYFEAKQIQVKMKCSECTKGYFNVTDGDVLDTNPLLFPHKCDGCGAMGLFDKAYPYLKIISGNLIKE